MIQELVDKSASKVKSLLKANAEWSKRFPPLSDEKGIPTLKSGVYRPLTAQLNERYGLLGRWEWATHGHWLSTGDMEGLWVAIPPDDLLRKIQRLRGLRRTELA